MIKINYISKNKLDSQFDYYLNCHIDERKFQVAKSTFTSDKARVRRIKQLLPSKALVDFIHSDIPQFILKLQKMGYNNKTINEYLSVLRVIFSRAFLDDKIVRNPMTGIKNLKYTPKEPNPFEKNEISLMHEVQTMQQGEKNAVFFNIFSGVRIGELLALAWEDVDFKCAV